MGVKTIAYNAICYMLYEVKLTIPEICEYIGCTKMDLIELGLIDEDECKQLEILKSLQSH